jgi:Tfp pilus assembly protein PilF
VLQAALEEEPDNLGAKRGMVEVYLEEGNWDEAQRLLDEVSAENQPELQVWALTQLAELARVGLQDGSLRQGYEEEALTLAAEHTELLTQLVDQYGQRRQQQRLLQVGATVVEKTSNAEAAARLRVVLARLLVDLNQPVRAMDYLRDSLAADPQHIEARLLMSRAMEQSGEMEAAVGSYRELLAQDAGCAEAYRGLYRLMGVLGKPTLADSAAAMLDLIGVATAEEQAKARDLDRLDVPPGTLDVALLPIDLEQRQLREALELAAPHLAPVFPLELNQLQKWSHPAATAAKRLAGVLGLSGVKVSVEGDLPARAGVGDPASLQIAYRLASKPGSAAFRFWIGRALARAATPGALLGQLSDGQLGELIEALTVQRPIDTLTQKLRKQVLKALPRKVRKLVDQVKPEHATAEVWKQYRDEERIRADRVGMLVCGSPRAAIAELATSGGFGDDPTRSPYMRQLMRFAVSDDYARLHARLWSAAGHTGSVR